MACINFSFHDLGNQAKSGRSDMRKERERTPEKISVFTVLVLLITLRKEMKNWKVLIVLGLVLNFLIVSWLLVNRDGQNPKNFDESIPKTGDITNTEEAIRLSAETLVRKVEKKITRMEVNNAIEDILQYVRSVNKYMEEKAPWKLVKVDKERAGTVLYTAGEALRISAVLLSPVMPNRTENLLDALNAKGEDLNWGGLKSGSKLKAHKPLFPRIK